MAVASPPEPQALAQRFEAIRLQFVRGLVERGRAIDGAADAAQLQAALHQLCGAAGAFGYEELGQRARLALQASQAGEARQLGEALQALRRDMRDLCA